MSSFQKKAGRIGTASLLSIGAIGMITPAQAAPVDTLFGTFEVPSTLMDRVGGSASTSLFSSSAATPAVPEAQVQPVAPEAASASAQTLAVPEKLPAVKLPTAEPVKKERQANVGQAIVDAARTRTGAPYAWGAAGPDSFDCSGLVVWAHQQVGISIPRTSQAQISAGTPVSLSELQPGDVIGYYSGNSHVAIYVGDGKIIHASDYGVPVKEQSLNYMPVNAAVRFH